MAIVKSDSPPVVGIAYSGETVYVIAVNGNIAYRRGGGGVHDNPAGGGVPDFEVAYGDV